MTTKIKTNHAIKLLNVEISLKDKYNVLAQYIYKTDYLIELLAKHLEIDRDIAKKLLINLRDKIYEKFSKITDKLICDIVFEKRSEKIVVRLENVKIMQKLNENIEFVF